MDQCKHCIIRGTDITICTDFEMQLKGDKVWIRSEESGPCNVPKQYADKCLELAEAIEYIKRLNDELADERESADEAERELAEARDALDRIAKYPNCEYNIRLIAKAALAGKEKEDA